MGSELTVSPDDIEARAILQATHTAWSDRDIEDTLAQYCENMTYVCHAGAVDGGPLTVRGKQQFRDFLQPVLETFESQLFTLECGKIASLVEIHGAPKMEAFWNLVLNEDEEPAARIFQALHNPDQLSWKDQLPKNWPR